MFARFAKILKSTFLCSMRLASGISQKFQCSDEFLVIDLSICVRKVRKLLLLYISKYGTTRSPPSVSQNVVPVRLIVLVVIFISEQNPLLT